MDQFNKLSVVLKGKISKQNLWEPHIQQNSIEKLNIKDFKGFAIEINNFPILYSIMFKGEFDVAFSINMPDRLFVYDKPLKLAGFSNTIFIRDTNEKEFLSEYQEKYLHDFLKFVEQLKLEGNESVFYYKNGISFIISKKRDIYGFLTMAASIIHKNRPDNSKKESMIINSAIVPKTIRHLIPLVEEFGITDDNLRSKMRDNLNIKKKKELIQVVHPFIGDINKYLDSFGNDLLSEDAIKFGCLAELITELMIEK